MFKVTLLTAQGEIETIKNVYDISKSFTRVTNRWVIWLHISGEKSRRYLSEDIIKIDTLNDIETGQPL